MKLTRKALPTLMGLLLLGFVAGTLAWEVVERLAGAVGLALDLGIGPVSLDLHAVAVTLRANPGSLVGMVGGGLLFRGL